VFHSDLRSPTATGRKQSDLLHALSAKKRREAAAFHNGGRRLSDIREPKKIDTTAVDKA
jgi:hypothetical protein